MLKEGQNDPHSNQQQTNMGLLTIIKKVKQKEKEMRLLMV